MAGTEVELSEAIEALGASLTKSMELGAGHGMQFALDPIELTVEAVVTKDANGKVGWKIFEVGGGYQSMKTQRLTLRLTPVWKRRDGVLVRDFTIADVQPANEEQRFG